MQTASDFDFSTQYLIDYDNEALKSSITKGNSSQVTTQDTTLSSNTSGQSNISTFDLVSSSSKGNSSNKNCHQGDFHKINFQFCDECRSDQVVYNSVEGSYVCQRCGLVLHKSCITDSYYQNAHYDEDDDDNLEMRGCDDKYDINRGITTIVTGKNSYQLKKYQNNSSVKKGMTKEAKKELANFAVLLNIKENALNLAKSILKDLADKEIRKGLNQSGKIPAALFVASRQSGYPKDVNQILLITRCEASHLNSWYKAIKSMQQEPSQQKDQKKKTSVKQIFDQQQYKLTESMCNKMNMNMEILRVSQQIAQRIRDTEELTGRKPETISAVAIHICVKLSKQSELIKSTSIVKATGVAQKTIRAAFKVIKDYLPEIVPKEWSGYGNLHTLLEE